MMQKLLEIKELYAGVAEGGKEIIKGLNLTINAGEIHAIMGPNGAGKSTLSYILTGKPDYVVTSGSMHFCGQDLNALKPEERAADPPPDHVGGTGMLPVPLPGGKLHGPGGQRRKCASGEDAE